MLLVFWIGEGFEECLELLPENRTVTDATI
jgi:hypothetical protein